MHSSTLCCWTEIKNCWSTSLLKELAVLSTSSDMALLISFSDSPPVTCMSPITTSLLCMLGMICGDSLRSRTSPEGGYFWLWTNGRRVLSKVWSAQASALANACSWGSSLQSSSYASASRLSNLVNIAMTGTWEPRVMKQGPCREWEDVAHLRRCQSARKTRAPSEICWYRQESNT